MSRAEADTDVRRERLAAQARAALDATAGEELRPCSDDAPGHDVDLGEGGQ